MVDEIHLKNAGAPGGKRNALNLPELFSSVLALIDSGTGAGKDHRGVSGIDNDRKNVGIFDYALLDVVPGFAAVFGLPRQVPGARIDYVRIHGVDGNRFHVLDLGVMFGRNALPGIASVAAAENAVERAGDQHPGIRRRNGQSANRLAMEIGDRIPAAPAVAGAEHIAGGRGIHAPRGHIHDLGVVGIDHDVVEHHAAGSPQVREAGPRRAAVAGKIETSRAGAEKDAIGVVGIVRKTADIAAVGAHGPPLLRLKPDGHQQKKNNDMCASVHFEAIGKTRRSLRECHAVFPPTSY